MDNNRKTKLTIDELNEKHKDFFEKHIVNENKDDTGIKSEKRSTKKKILLAVSAIILPVATLVSPTITIELPTEILVSYARTLAQRIISICIHKYENNNTRKKSYNIYEKNYFQEEEVDNYRSKKCVLENIGLLKTENRFNGHAGGTISHSYALFAFFNLIHLKIITPFFSSDRSNEKLTIFNEDIDIIKQIYENLENYKELNIPLSINYYTRYRYITNHAIGIKIQKTENGKKIKIGIMNSNGEDLSQWFQYLFSKCMHDSSIAIEVTNTTKIADQGSTNFCSLYTLYNLNKKFFNDIGIDYEKNERKNFNARLNAI